MKVYEDYPQDCNAPQPQPLLAVIYFGVFITIAAQVLITLFIGVVSTSMDEATQIQNVEKQISIELETVKRNYNLSEKQIKAFRSVFEMLDLDKSGMIELSELMVGATVLDDPDLNESKICDIYGKINTGHEGINIRGFVSFMCLTPKFREAALKVKVLSMWNRNVAQSKRKTLFGKFLSYFKLGDYITNKDAQALEAVIVIQTFWRSKRRQRKEAENNSLAYRISGQINHSVHRVSDAMNTMGTKLLKRPTEGTPDGTPEGTPDKDHRSTKHKNRILE